MEKLTILIILCSLSFLAFSKTIYVDANGIGDYTTIQEAINDANDGDIILLSDGTYAGVGNRDIDFLGKAITLKSLNGPNDCIIDCNGTESNPHRGFYFRYEYDVNSVLYGLTITNGYQSYGGGISYERSSGLTIIDCIFRNNSAKNDGGGINNEVSNLTLRKCSFIENSAKRSGGGMSNLGSSSILIQCSFTKNSAREFSGAMCNEFSDSTLRQCSFIENSVEQYHINSGGGMYNYKSSANLFDCSFTENTDDGIYNGEKSYSKKNSVFTNCSFTGNSGSGMVNDSFSPTVTDCVFEGNSGRGMINESCSPVITNCRFVGNSNGGMYNIHKSDSIITNCSFIENSADYGGGIKNKSSNPIIKNCVFKDNFASDGGGGMLNSGGRPIINNCSFVDNLARYGGGMNNKDNSTPIIIKCTFYDGSQYVIYNSNSAPILTGCILWNKYGAINDTEKTPVITYSVVKGGWPGKDNTDLDPLFVSPGYWEGYSSPVWIKGDYHLLPDSPCINTGNPNYIPEPDETDLDGLPRVIGGRIDMGAYEYDSRPVAIAGPNQTAYAFIDGLADVNLDGSASYDNEGDVLNYYWSWYIDPNLYEADGVSPTIQLPAGEYQIELIVDDGVDFSEPNYCTVTVIEPLKAKLCLWPMTINCSPRPRYVTTLTYLPRNIKPGDVNDVPLTMYPCEIQSKYQRVFRMGRGRCARTVVTAVFEKKQICDCLGTGWHKVTVTGRLKSGRYFCGTNSLIISKPYHWFFRRSHNRQ